MAKKSKSRVPELRRGLTVDELLADTWMVKKNRYASDGEMVELSTNILKAACQGLIDKADAGERITRRTVISTLCGAAQMLICAKDQITQKMGQGMFTTTLLDKISNC